MKGVERSKRLARKDDSARVLLTCRLAMAHSGPPGLPSIRPNGRFMLSGRTMIRHASHPGAVTAVSFGVHGAATRGCLKTSAGLPLPLGGRPARRSPCSKSGPGRIACK
jgi:hypothetical protein